MGYSRGPAHSVWLLLWSLLLHLVLAECDGVPSRRLTNLLQLVWNKRIALRHGLDCAQRAHQSVLRFDTTWTHIKSLQQRLERDRKHSCLWNRHRLRQSIQLTRCHRCRLMRSPLDPFGLSIRPCLDSLPLQAIYLSHQRNIQNRERHQEPLTELPQWDHQWQLYNQSFQ